MAVYTVKIQNILCQQIKPIWTKWSNYCQIIEYKNQSSYNESLTLYSSGKVITISLFSQPFPILIYLVTRVASKILQMSSTQGQASSSAQRLAQVKLLQQSENSPSTHSESALWYHTLNDLAQMGSLIAFSDSIKLRSNWQSLICQTIFYSLKNLPTMGVWTSSLRYYNLRVLFWGIFSLNLLMLIQKGWISSYAQGMYLLRKFARQQRTTQRVRKKTAFNIEAMIIIIVWLGI